MTLRESVIALLSEWQAPDAGQDALRQAVLGFVLARDDACRRACEPGHITASTLVLDHRGERVLLTLHPRLRRWVGWAGTARTRTPTSWPPRCARPSRNPASPTCG